MGLFISIITLSAKSSQVEDQKHFLKSELLAKCNCRDPSHVCAQNRENYLQEDCIHVDNPSRELMNLCKHLFNSFCESEGDFIVLVIAATLVAVVFTIINCAFLYFSSQAKFGESRPHILDQALQSELKDIFAKPELQSHCFKKITTNAELLQILTDFYEKNGIATTTLLLQYGVLQQKIVAIKEKLSSGKDISISQLITLNQQFHNATEENETLQVPLTQAKDSFFVKHREEITLEIQESYAPLLS